MVYRGWDATASIQRRGVAREGVRGLAYVIGTDLDFLAGNYRDLLLIERLAVGIAQLDGVGAGV